MLSIQSHLIRTVLVARGEYYLVRINFPLHNEDVRALLTTLRDASRVL